ncbi:tetratricopeptide repeat protein [Periweissella fabalis]|uniref:Tetratricopeptide repeat protein n=1 Tax=Periweissella fabalis TaxID=1070421 RepID=A0A7X6N0X4_9LACO|nr:tetratricopeptide repeat protein [Periweissella fabalis]MCM0599479.1 tetratricopeptide repeat protein [Periweissella fabalis]NKZ23758.1 tetratricopeptide repeat protein [Periweissella fabalis]
MEEKRRILANEVDQTIKKLVSMINKNPNDWRNYNDLGIVLVQIADYASAEELIMKALGLFKTDAKAQQSLLYTLGNVYYGAGEYQKAMKYYQKIIDNTIKGDAFVMIAQSFMQQKQYQQALVYALTAQEMLPDDVKILILVGDIWLALGDFDKADVEYRRALSYDTDNVAALFGRGIIALTLNRPSAALFARVEQLDSKYYADNKQRVDEIATVIHSRQNK